MNRFQYVIENRKLNQKHFWILPSQITGSPICLKVDYFQMSAEK